ncbi:MAG: NAD(+) synthase [Kiritimatiellia bacterium]
MKKAGAIKTRLVQMKVSPGRPRDNTEVILENISAARSEDVRLVVFPELAVPGYLIGDEWEREAFLRECEECSEEIRAASCDITVVFGNVAIDWNKKNRDGRVRKYDALFTAVDGKFIGPEKGPCPFVVKSLLPDYREFDDNRHFCGTTLLAEENNCRPRDLIAPVRTPDLVLGCALCEDAWDENYPYSPLKLLSERGADIIVVISASPFTADKNHKRTRLFLKHASELNKPIVYANNTGVQNNGKNVFVFDGSSRIYDNHGHAVSLPALREDALTFEIPVDGRPFGEAVTPESDGVSEIYRVINYGTSEFLGQCGQKRVVVGISGGIDSSVAAAMYAGILPPEDLLLVSMPGPYTSKRTRSLAAELASGLGCRFAETGIDESVRLTSSQINGLTIAAADGSLKDTLHLKAEMLENVQARDRSSRLLAAVAAAFGGVFTCNANKAEAAVGYTTLYGDLAGWFANLADLWKTEIYQLASYLNSEIYGREVIPAGSLSVKPSAELSTTQNVEKGGGDPFVYAYHDLLFRSWIEWWNKADPEDILLWYSKGELEERLGCTSKISGIFPEASAFIADLERWWNRYQGLAAAKRIQSPPILVLKRRAFGYDHRESQMGPRYTRKYLEVKRRLLKKT